jgi:hypothetical protein
MNLPDLMIDLETLDVTDSAVVVSLGAQFFDIASGGYPEPAAISSAFDFQKQIDLGRTVSASTIKWWMTQGNAARSETFNATQYPFQDIALLVTDMMNEYNTTRVWGNGAGFDLNILRSLYRTHGLEFPFRYSADMDLRTLRMLAGNPKYPTKQSFVAHAALDDARYQVLCAQMYWGMINAK